MKLKEYLKQLKKIADLNTELLEREVIYAKDDEGNEYNKVIFNPSLIKKENIEESFLETTGSKESMNNWKTYLCIN